MGVHAEVPVAVAFSPFFQNMVQCRAKFRQKRCECVEILYFCAKYEKK